MVLAGRYELVSLLGAGGFGEVYKACDRLLNRIVAIKTLHTSRSLSTESRERFLREARATARLQHENVVTLHDVGEDGGRLFLVLEFVDGTPLSEMLRSGPIDSRTVATVICDVARALDAAHRMGIVHRDIKPANVLVRADGRVKVADFGIARLTDETDITKEGAVVGTLRYMSPEQLEGERVTPQSDLFSLGCVAYEAVAGQPPFEGETASDLLANTLRGKRRKSPDALRREPGLAAVIEQLLQREAAARGSAGDVVRQLDPLAVTAYRPAVESRPARRRHAMLAVAAVAFIAAIVVVWSLVKPGSDRAAARSATIIRSVRVQHAGVVNQIAERSGAVRRRGVSVLSNQAPSSQHGRTGIRMAGLSFALAPASAGEVSVAASADQIDYAAQAVRLFDQLSGYRFHEEGNDFFSGTPSTREISIDVKGEPHRLLELVASAAGWPMVMDPSAAATVRQKLGAPGSRFELQLTAPWDAVVSSVLHRYDLGTYRLDRIWLVGSRKRVSDWNAKRGLVAVSKAMRTDLDSAARVARAASSDRGTVLVNRRLHALVISDYPEVIRRQMEILAKFEGTETHETTTLRSAMNFSGDRVDIHLRAMDVRDYISMVSRLTGLSTVVDPDVKGFVSVDLQDVAWDEAFDAILKSTGNSYAFRRNILEVIPESKDANDEVVVETVKLRREDPLFFEAWSKSLSPQGSLVTDQNAKLLVIRGVRRNAIAFRNLAERLDGEVSNASRFRIAEEIHRKGVAAAFDLQKRLGRSDPDYDYDEPQWNAIGYSLLEKKEMAKATEVFNRVVAEHPQSSNAYDSLAEAYMKSGQKALAVVNYRRSLELNRENFNARQMLKQLER